MTADDPSNPHDDKVGALRPYDARIERMERTDEGVELGQWYWIREIASWHDEEEGYKRGEEVTRLYCVVGLASNHALLHTPTIGTTTHTNRVRYEDFVPPTVTREYAPDAVFAEKVAGLQAKSAALLGKVNDLMSSLGVGGRPAISGPQDEGSTGTGLMVMSGTPDMGVYKGALVKAQKEDLPALFKEIETTNKAMAAWMTAPTVALKAMMGPLKDRTDLIEERIFSVELYAGLTEKVHRICDGAAAEYGERLRVMQRRLYMDEECLAFYDDGGLDIRSLKDFDHWLARPENRDRLLPFPRTIVAMRVRRHEKDRPGFKLGDILDNAILSEADKKTFLFLRNGEQVWRLSCDLEFGEMIFPDPETSNLGGPLMVKISPTWGWSRPHENLMSVMKFEALSEERRLHSEKVAEWQKTNPKVSYMDEPWWVRHEGPRHHGNDFQPENWEALTPNSLEYDGAMKAINDEIAAYNRICLIIQGLFDRSPVLHPHPRVQLWDPSGFAEAVEMVFDATRALPASAEPPDFEAYRRRCNETLDVGSVVAGVEPLWLVREAERENKRLDSDWRADDRRHTTFRPYGDPGPGLLATVSEWGPRRRAATVRWTRERRGSFRRDTVPCALVCEADTIFNVSAYRPGDFRQFFADPRTRAEYLQWAPMLMAAEDWHAGRLEERPGQPGIWENPTRRNR